MRRLVILAEGNFNWRRAKTATGVIRYGYDQVVAVIDSTQAGQDVSQVLKSTIGTGIPVVRDIQEALHYQPDTLMIGIAPVGGALPDAWRGQLLTAIENSMDVISGLHFFLSDDETLRGAAQQHNVKLWDVRRPPALKRVATFQPHRPGSRTILMVGSDCSVGKMTVALEMEKVTHQRGLSSAFLATGQTGIMISGNGFPADAIVSDFIAGVTEEYVLNFTQSHDWVFVEGQGALNHPGFSPVTLGLLHGSLPDALIFCHRAGATHIDGYPDSQLPSLKRMIQINEEAISWLKPDHSCKVVGLALMTHLLDEKEARAAVQRASEETGLPATDVLRFGAELLVDTVINALS